MQNIFAASYIWKMNSRGRVEQVRSIWLRSSSGTDRMYAAVRRMLPAGMQLMLFKHSEQPRRVGHAPCLAL